MRFYGREKAADASPSDSYGGHNGGESKTQYPQNYPGAVGYGDDLPPNADYDADLHVQCPSHTTERKLMMRIDLHVIPFLCILYRMFLLQHHSESAEEQS